MTAQQSWNRPCKSRTITAQPEGGCYLDGRHPLPHVSLVLSLQLVGLLRGGNNSEGEGLALTAIRLHCRCQQRDCILWHFGSILLLLHSITGSTSGACFCWRPTVLPSYERLSDAS